ncbi:MAG: glutathione S-transferase family protein [Oleiphilaceae bacterium]|nr:glutathione S-transferase family protein [Oleiphilaceae bacterium]
MSLTVYGYPNTRTLRVTWLLEELGLDYNFQLVDLMKGEARQTSFLELNAGGKVPAIRVDGGIITESLAIMNYLCTLKPEAELIPTYSAFRRAQYDQWSVFAIAELEQPLWTMGKHKFALPKDYRVREMEATSVYEFQVALDLLSKGLGQQDYILGDSFSAADILLGHCLFWGMSFGQSIEQENLKAYIGRLGVRPALGLARQKEKQAMSD